MSTVAPVLAAAASTAGATGVARWCSGGAPGGPARRLLERQWAAGLVQADRLAVEHQLPARQGADRGDHLGHPGGDLVEAAGEHGDVGAGAVHLDADAVELHVDHRRRAGRGERLVDRGGALREHRRQRPADLQPEPGQLGRSAGQRGHRHGAQVTGEQQRPADRRHRHLGGPGHGVGEQPGLGALPQLAAEQAGEQPLLVGGGRARRGRRAAPGGGPASRCRAPRRSASMAASTAATVSVGSAAGGGRSRRLA